MLRVYLFGKVQILQSLLGENMHSYSITIRSLNGTSRYFALAHSSFQALMAAYATCGDVVCGVTVTNA